MNLTRPRQLILVLWLCKALGMNTVFSFEQGSYFIFDIVASKEAAPVKGRLALPKSVMAENDTEGQSVAPAARNEFEFDYTQKIQSGRFKGLDIDVFDTTPKETSTVPTESPENTSFDLGTDLFDFGP